MHHVTRDQLSGSIKAVSASINKTDADDNSETQLLQWMLKTLEEAKLACLAGDQEKADRLFIQALGAEILE